MTISFTTIFTIIFGVYAIAESLDAVTRMPRGLSKMFFWKLKYTAISFAALVVVYPQIHLFFTYDVSASYQELLSMLALAVVTSHRMIYRLRLAHELSYEP